MGAQCLTIGTGGVITRRLMTCIYAKTRKRKTRQEGEYVQKHSTCHQLSVRSLVVQTLQALLPLGLASFPQRRSVPLLATGKTCQSLFNCSLYVTTQGALLISNANYAVTLLKHFNLPILPFPIQMAVGAHTFFAAVCLAVPCSSKVP